MAKRNEVQAIHSKAMIIVNNTPEDPSHDEQPLFAVCLDRNPHSLELVTG